jgi:hypothetical protein
VACIATKTHTSCLGWGHTLAFGDVGSMSGLPESGRRSALSRCRQETRAFGRPSTLADRPTVLFSLRSAELFYGFLMQDPNLSQVSLCFFNIIVPDGRQLFLERNLASMIQRGFKSLDAKRSTNCKGILLLRQTDCTAPALLGGEEGPCPTSLTLDMYGDKLITLAVNDQIASKVIDVATGRPLKSRSSDSRRNRPSHHALRFALTSPRKMEAAMGKDSEMPVKHRTGPDKKGTEDYRGLAERVREAAHRVSMGKERTDLLAMAKIWDFLADHGPHVRH